MVQGAHEDQGHGSFEGSATRTWSRIADRYTAVIEAGLQAGGLYDGFVTDLKNQCSYFEIDMSDAAMEKLTTNRDKTKHKSESLFKSVARAHPSDEGATSSR